MLRSPRCWQAGDYNKMEPPGDALPSREKLMEKYKQALSIAQKAKNARDEAIKDNKLMLTENETLREKVKSLDKQYNTAQEMLAALTEQKLKLAMEIDDLKKQKALFIQELEAREKSEIEVETFKRQYHRLLKENEDLIRKFGSTESDSIQLRKELDELKRNHESMKQMYENVQSEKEDLDKNFKDTVERLRVLQKSQNDFNAIMSNKFNKTVNNIQEWSDVILPLVTNSSQEELLLEIETLKAEKEKSNNSISLITREKENFEQEVSDLNESIRCLRKELEIANSDRDKMVSNLEKVGLETKELIENSEKLTDEIEFLKKDRIIHDQKIMFLQNEKENLSRIIRENEIEINRLTTEFVQCQRLNEELSQKVDLFESSNYHDDLTNSDALQKSVDSLDDRSDTMYLPKIRKEKSMSKEGSVNSELNQLQEELQVFSCELVKYKQIADENEQKYKKAIEELSEKQEQLNEKDSRLEQFQQKVSFFEEQQEVSSLNLSQCKLQLLSALQDLSNAEEIKNQLKVEAEFQDDKLNTALEELKDKDIIISGKLEEVKNLEVELSEKNSTLGILGTELQQRQLDDAKNQIEIKSLIEESSDLKSTIGKMIEENKIKFQECQKEINKLLAELSESRQRNENLSKENTKLNKQLKDQLNEQANENTNLVKKLTCLQDSMQTQVTEKQMVINGLEHEINLLTSEVSKLNENNINISSENNDLKTKLKSLDIDNSEKYSALTKLNAKLQETLDIQLSLSADQESAISDLKKELNQTKSETEKLNELLSLEKLNSKKLITDCAKKLIVINRNILKDEGILKKHSQDVDYPAVNEEDLDSGKVLQLLHELEGNQVSLHEELNSIIVTCNSLTNEKNNSLENQFKELNLASLRISELQVQLKEAEGKLVNQAKVIEELEKEKVKLIKQKEELSITNLNQNEKNDELNNHLSTLKKNVSDLEKQLIELGESQKMEIDKHNESVKDLESCVEGLRNREKELTDIESKYKLTIEELNNINILLTEENSTLKVQLTEKVHLNQEKIENIDAINTLNDKIAELTEVNNSLSKNVSSFEENIQTMRKEHAEEIVQMTNRIRKVQDELKNCNELLSFKTLELKENNRIWAGRFSSLKIALMGLNKSRKEIKNHFECIEDLFMNLVGEIKEPLQYKVQMVIQDSLTRAKHELITEMQQMNQALKERGESISKLEFAVSGYQNKLKQMSSLNDNLNSELLKVQTELKEMKDSVQEKTTYIKQLEEENEQLKESHDNNTETDVLSTSTISRTEEYARLKDVEDSLEERYSKLKLLAVKMKKRIGELTQTLENERSKMTMERNELQEKISGMSMAVKNAQKLQELFDQSLDERDELKKINKTLENTVEEFKNTEEDFKTKIATLTSSNQNIPVMRKHIDSLNAVIKESKTEIHKLQMEIKAENIKFEEVKKMNGKLETKVQELTTSLEQAKQQGKNSNVLELEIKNYGEIIADLSSQIAAEKNIVKSLQVENEAAKNVKVGLEEEISILEKQLKIEEERNQHNNEQLNSTRHKLDETSSQIENLKKELEDIQKELSSEKHKTEALTLEMSLVTAEFSKKEITMTSRIGTLQEQIRSLETSLLAKKQELTTSKHEIDHLNEEYESYKLRAQTILSKKKGEFVTHGEKEAKEEVERLKKDCKLLEEKIEAYIIEVDTLNTRLSSLSLEKTRSDKKYEEMKQALQQKIADYDLLNTEYYNYKITNETTTENLKDEMFKKKNEYQSEISYLRKIIDDLTSEFKLKEESLQSIKDKNENSTLVSSLQEPMPLPLEREDGEGSESVPSPDTRRRSSIVPLDILLNSPIVDENKVTVLQEQTEKLRRELYSYEVRCRHLSSLLSEAEKDSARNLHQNKILKEELRRLERSLERHPHVANTEYLKNVVFKFVTLPHGDERLRLVPVLDTLLKLSPGETHKLNSVAKGESQAGWGSYLQSWTGL